MKRIMMTIGIAACLLVGCAKPYLPPDVKEACFRRTVELKRAQELDDPAVYEQAVQLDLEFLTDLLEASK